MNINIKNSATSKSRHYITSHDGTVIGYESLGKGPGLILVQGAMGTVQNYYELACYLSGHFNVYLLERRGRGLSPKPYESHHSITDDVSDLRSLLDHTGAEYLFGLSSGAMIVLAALMDGVAVTKAVVYEPPFYLDGMPLPLIQIFNNQVEAGLLADALLTAGRIVELSPAHLHALPLWVRRLGAKFALMTNAGWPKGYASLKALIPAMRYDFNIVASMNEQFQQLRNIRQEVLLMGGNNSPDYLKNALAAMELELPNSRCIRLAGADHSAPWNEDLSGMPSLVAHFLKSYFQ